jgi:hypothetical protein
MKIFAFPLFGALSGHLGIGSLLLLISGIVAGCETVSVPQAPSYLDTFSLGEITVSYAEVDQPLLVAELDGEISKSVSGPSTLETLGTRFGAVNWQSKQLALQEAISANIKPHVRDALTPLLRGARPARAEVVIKSVFIRSRFGLQQLTGTRVFIDGVKRPDYPQLVAGLRLYDQETGLPLREIRPITRIDDGTITIAGGGPKAPSYGPSVRLNTLAFEFARAAANALKRNVASEDFAIPASEGDVTTLWSRGTSN